jgi:hypothetical protein
MLWLLAVLVVAYCWLSLEWLRKCFLNYLLTLMIESRPS